MVLQPHLPPRRPSATRSEAARAEQESPPQAHRLRHARCLPVASTTTRMMVRLFATCVLFVHAVGGNQPTHQPTVVSWTQVVDAVCVFCFVFRFRLLCHALTFSWCVYSRPTSRVFLPVWGRGVCAGDVQQRNTQVPRLWVCHFPAPPKRRQGTAQPHAHHRRETSAFAVCVASRPSLCTCVVFNRAGVLIRDMNELAVAVSLLPPTGGTETSSASERVQPWRHQH